MRFQLDENASARTLAEYCEKQGLVEVWRWPKKLKGAEDPAALAYTLPSGRALLTTDRQIHVQHSVHIPDGHPGILIVASTSSAETMRTSLLMRILAKFKGMFPTWHKTCLTNSIVEITETSVEVWKVVGGALARDTFLHFEETAWQDRLSTVLESNARGSQLSDGTQNTL
jgi:hypothetical protein